MPGRVDVPRVDLLGQWGLRVDDKVRWRPAGKRTWTEGRVTGIEGDGSVGCVDADGRARALVADRLQVWRRTGRGRRWEPLAGPQQLALFAEPLPDRAPARAGVGAPARRSGRRR